MTKPSAFLALTAASLALVVAWWLVAFEPVLSTSLMTVPQAASCLLLASDTCSLAQALCTGSHLLDIRRYEPVSLWLALALLSVSLLARVRRAASPSSLKRTKPHDPALP